MIENNSGLILQQQGSLKNALVSVELQVTATMINSLRDIAQNALDDEFSESDLITKTEKKKYSNELSLIFVGFYGIVISLEGARAIDDRMKETGLPATFTLDRVIKKYINKTSDKISKGHIDTIASDIYKTAFEEALKGKSLIEIESILTDKFALEITRTRATTVARTETNRAFTRAQYEADRQFKEQNDLEGKVFKRWITRSDNPCPFCIALEKEGLIPFDQDFRGLGDNISVTIKGKKKTLSVDFEPLQSGNAHPNCNCAYEIIIKP